MCECMFVCVYFCGWLGVCVCMGGGGYFIHFLFKPLILNLDAKMEILFKENVIT